VVHRLKKSLGHREVALGVFLDIAGAFDNTFINRIITAGAVHVLEETCCRWIGSTIDYRLVHTAVMGSSLTAKVLGGCPQGGILSHLLWNLVADTLFIATNDLGFRTCGYADDMVIIIHSKFVHTVREIMQKALNVVDKRAIKEGLNISPHKKTIVPFTNRRK